MTGSSTEHAILEIIGFLSIAQFSKYLPSAGATKTDIP